MQATQSCSECACTVSGSSIEKLGAGSNRITRRLLAGFAFHTQIDPGMRIPPVFHAVSRSYAQYAQTPANSRYIEPLRAEHLFDSSHAVLRSYAQALTHINADKQSSRGAPLVSLILRSLT